MFLLRFLARHKYLLLFIGCVLVGLCLAQPDTATADAASATPAASGGGDAKEGELITNIISVMNFIFSMLATLLGPMVVLAGWLLSPDWTMGDFFGLRPYFREVWILVSNIVYIIFAMILLYMAIMQIFGSSESEYAFKKALPKFIVGILIVPFTWMIVSFTLSFANQAVAAVLSIPMGSITNKLDQGKEGDKKSFWHRKVIPTKFSLSGNNENDFGTKCGQGFTTDGKAQAPTPCISPAEFIAYNQAGPFFIIMIYAYDIFKIQETDLNALTGKDACGSAEMGFKSAKECTKSLLSVLKKFGINLVIAVFFAIILVALCWVLLMRSIKLWIYIMLSPLFGLAYFTGTGFGESTGEAGEMGFGSVGFMQFFKLAMVPVLVSGVLAFGLLFIGVVRDGFHGAVTGEKGRVGDTNLYCTGGDFLVKYCLTETKDGSGETIHKSRLIIGTDTSDKNKTRVNNPTGEGDYTISIDFDDTFSSLTASPVGGLTSGTVDGIQDIFAHTILTIMALAFLFIGVKAAVNYDEVTKAAFKPFAGAIEGAASFATSYTINNLPLPHPAFRALMPSGMTAAAELMKQWEHEDTIRTQKGFQDMLQDTALMGLSGMAEDFNRGAATFADAVAQYGQVNRKFRDNDESRKYLKEILPAAIRAIPDTVLPAADKTRLIAEVEDAPSVAEMHTILSGNAAFSGAGTEYTNLLTHMQSAQAGGAQSATTNIATGAGATQNATITRNGTTFSVSIPGGGPPSSIPTNFAGGVAPNPPASAPAGYTEIQAYLRNPPTDINAKLQRLFPGIQTGDLANARSYFNLYP